MDEEGLSLSSSVEQRMVGQFLKVTPVMGKNF